MPHNMKSPDAKMAFNNPPSSKNNTGVITNHPFATRPGLQQVQDGDSHKQEVTRKINTIRDHQ